MTEATRSRELRKVFDSILASRGIENLELSIDLVGAARRMYEETKHERTAAEVRADIEKAIQTGARKRQPRALMAERIEKACRRFGYNFNGAANYEQERLITWCMNVSEGRSIEKFAEWICNDAFWYNKIANVNKIIELWYRQDEAGERGRALPENLTQIQAKYEALD